MSFFKLKIKTGRLDLVPLSEEHVQDFFKGYTAKVATFMRRMPATELFETKAFIQRKQKKMSEGMNVNLAILSQNGKKFCGTVSLHGLNTPTPGFAIWLIEKAQGKGYGTEALKALKTWADQNIKYEYLLYPVAKKNFASCRLAEKLGGKIVREYHEKKSNGKRLKCYEYRIYPDKNNFRKRK